MALLWYNVDREARRKGVTDRANADIVDGRMANGRKRDEERGMMLSRSTIFLDVSAKSPPVTWRGTPFSLRTHGVRHMQWILGSIEI